MHVFPDVKRLETKYRDTLVVIGVHSAKFDTERENESIRKAILRHGLEHPIVNDRDFKIWRSYGVQAWPTLLLIDPEGIPVGKVSGEGHYETLDRAIQNILTKFEGKLNKKPLTLSLEKAKARKSALYFPGKIAATADRLYISDTGHYRILVMDHSGKVLDILGSGEEGAEDGTYTEARFRGPQGLFLSGDALYVADEQNHGIRKVDLKEKCVQTIAGTGEIGRRAAGGDAHATALNSPWDLALDGDRLFIAMAGNHQIWVLHLKKGRIEPFSGDGGENIVDGPHRTARFAQPSGLAIGNGKLYVADSEVSAVRETDLDPKGSVRTLVGRGLFDFGDRDGAAKEVRLQHVLGVVWVDGKLYLADTYNHKIKVIDPNEKTCQTFLGDGRPGKEDGPTPRFHEPSGLAYSDGKLFVADTNNHAIRVVDLKTKEVHTLTVRGVK